MTVVPYTRLHPATARLLNRHAPGHRRVRIDPSDETGYWKLLAAEWSTPGDLVVVEHDIGISDGVVEGFASCRTPWCAHEYPIGQELLACLGCARFTAELKTAEPDLIDAVGHCADSGIPAKSWRRLDMRIQDELRRRGYRQHIHQPAVRHYHRYP